MVCAAVTTDAIKPFISSWCRAMINKSLNKSVPEGQRAEILETMLDLYQDNIAEHTAFFKGMSDTLDAIEAQGLKWGVVTNKQERFTNPLMVALKLTDRAGLHYQWGYHGQPKPHLEPMLLACKQAEVKPQECVYIGDASHDIIAGKNAQMKTLAALYGYLKPGDTPETWGADALIASPEQLATWISSALCH